MGSAACTDSGRRGTSAPTPMGWIIRIPMLQEVVSMCCCSVPLVSVVAGHKVFTRAGKETSRLVVEIVMGKSVGEAGRRHESDFCLP